MARFHINHKTGQPGPCKAQMACPFGDLQADHYDSPGDARNAYEAKMKAHTFKPKTKRKMMAGVSLVLAASFSLSGCKATDISIPDIQVPNLPTPSQSAPVTPGPTEATPPNVKELLDKLNTLEVKGRAPMTDYSRDKFVNRSQWDKTQQAMLKRDLTDITYRGDGYIYSGTLSLDPYTGKSIAYVRGGASEVDIDHVVSLGNAWVTGSQYQDAGSRLALATDPDNLLAVDASANRKKRDGDIATWKPMSNYRCTYVGKQITIKARYKLWVTPAEKKAMVEVINKNC